jgi:hypothetical protein
MELAKPSSPMERQITMNKWECVEQYMQMNPAVFEALVYRTPTYQYWVVRRQKTLVRVHRKV